MFDEHLIVVGTGIRSVGQMTIESIAWIRRADRVVYVITDPVGEAIVRELNPACESLSTLYANDKPRRETYEEMVQRVLELLSEGHRVCFAAYGHPGIFAFPTHEAVRRARAAGFRARMLPGISAEDCLFADLGVDPASAGCQSHEATDFLINQRTIDPTSHLVLWQIGVLGEPNGVLFGARPRGLARLVKRLCEDYSAEHRVQLYEGSLLPGVEPRVTRTTIGCLERCSFGTMATLYVPPARAPQTDWKVAEAFGFATNRDR